MSLDCLGANAEIGFDISQGLGTIFEAAGGLTTGITSMVKQDQDEKKLKADEASNLKTAQAKDIAAATALAKATVSAQLKAPSAAMDQKAAEVALTAQGQAAGKLSGDASEQRAAAAEKERATAISAAQAAPKDVYKSALVEAWTKVINAANNGTIVSKGAESAATPSHSSGEGSWFSKKTGPVPNWSLAAGGAAAVAALLGHKFLLARHS
jgi:hypothetical protein